MNKLTSTEVATVSANGRNHSPAPPPMNATGINTAMIENVVAVTARPISCVPMLAAVRRSLPISMCRTMFSRTTMASSISTPIASDKPSKVMKLSVNPHAQTAMKAAMTEVGSANAVMSVERHELRNAYTTKIVSTAPNISASITFCKLLCAFFPPSWVISSLDPVGNALLISATTVRTLLATVTVLASRERVMEIPTFGWALRTLKLLSSAKPSAIVATCPRRTTSLPRRLSTICSNSAGDSMRPTRRILCSSSVPLTRPTGAVVFCARNAATTSVTETLYSRSFSARSSTDNSRRSEPLTLTVATPSMARNLSASVSSARRDISAWVWLAADKAICMIGCVAGSIRRRMGSRISTGSLCRIEAIELRISSEASIMFFLKLKMMTMLAELSLAVERI